MPPAPTPFHILRAHQAPLSALHFSHSNTHLFAGDQDGRVSITDLTSRRVIAAWTAHEGGILGVGEWDGGLVSQGRDNKVNFYAPVAVPAGGPSLATGASTPPPRVVRSLDSNSLNFCRFSLEPLPSDCEGAEGLLVLPNLADSELIDIYRVPSMVRIHASVNYVPRAKAPEALRSGLVMTLHLRVVTDRAALVAGYEDGRAEVWACPLAALSSEWDGRKGPGGDGRGWERLWEGKCHNEAVMAMAVDRAFTRAFTVSADHLLVRVDLASVLENRAGEGTLSSYSTKQIGNGSLAVSSDGRVVAVGGWDGRIRLFSAATFKPLGSLSYHRESVHVLAFAHLPSAKLLGAAPVVDPDVLELGAESDSSDEDMGGSAGAGPRERWLASGGKDTRIALWSLMDFAAGR